MQKNSQDNATTSLHDSNNSSISQYGQARRAVGGGRRRRADHAPVGSPGTTTRSRPIAGAVVVRNLWWQTRGRRRPSVLRAPALRQLRRAAPVSVL